MRLLELCFFVTTGLSPTEPFKTEITTEYYTKWGVGIMNGKVFMSHILQTAMEWGSCKKWALIENDRNGIISVIDQKQCGPKKTPIETNEILEKLLES